MGPWRIQGLGRIVRWDGKAGWPLARLLHCLPLTLCLVEKWPCGLICPAEDREEELGWGQP